MKYVIFEDKKSRLLHPVIFGEHTTHSEIKIEGCKPVSAGFFHLSKKTLTVSGESESLKLKPVLPRDRGLLIHALMDMGTAFFIQL